MADLVRGQDEQVVEDFYWYLLHSTAAHAFPEGIYYAPLRWSETIPHVTGACNYAILLRHMLVHEQGDELHLLLPFPTGGWAPGREMHMIVSPRTLGERGWSSAAPRGASKWNWPRPNATRPGGWCCSCRNRVPC